MSKFDITGQQFGYWTVLGRDPNYKDPKKSKWICQCECGTVRSVFKRSLTTGRSKSCGCHASDNLKGINATHGMSKTRIYHVWNSMRRRCDCKSGKYGHGYTDRGITVCEEWNDFLAFYSWAMANGYDDTLSIERIDVNGNYCPENCKWIPLADQQQNKTTTIYVEYDGQPWCLRTLCVSLGFPYKTAHRRYQRMKAAGKPIDVEKLLEPVHTEKIAIKYRK